jgi:hypothetical protein
MPNIPEKNEMNIAQQVAILSRTPRVLHAWLDDLPDEWIRCDIGPGTFSPFDVVGHLIHGERTDWMVRLRLMLDHGVERPFGPFDRFAMYKLSKGKTLEQLLDEFEQLRLETLEQLRNLNLSENDLQIEGMHPELGRVTVSQLIATWVVHDLNHISQIARTMSFRYRDAVGPWRAYLSVLPKA